MPSSYSKFTFEDLKNLGIKFQNKQLFAGIAPAEPSDWLKLTLKQSLAQPLQTEKAKSELLISPILTEMAVRYAGKMAFFSGYTFDVDKAAGLRGFCDYIFSREVFLPIIQAPVFCIVEAKNDNLDLGTPQCVAEMHAADIFNQKQGKPIPQVFGAVTFGFAWRFLTYSNLLVQQDTDTYSPTELPKLLGVLQHIIETA